MLKKYSIFSLIFFLLCALPAHSLGKSHTQSKSLQTRYVQTSSKSHKHKTSLSKSHKKESREPHHSLKRRASNQHFSNGRTISKSKKSSLYKSHKSSLHNSQKSSASQSSALKAYTGMASYYSHNLHGTKTFSGEHYDKTILTAASRTLPMGTIVRVTNLRNERQVVVRINDRGPYEPNWIIDLSYEAAKRLDMLSVGIIKVRVEVIDKREYKPN